MQYVRDRNRVSPRVAVGISVHADQLLHLRRQTRLLGDLAFDGVLEGLAKLNEAARERVPVAERIVSPFHEDDPALVQENGVHGDPGKRRGRRLEGRAHALVKGAGGQDAIGRSASCDKPFCKAAIPRTWNAAWG